MRFKTIIPLFLLILISSLGCSQDKNKKAMKFKELTPEEERVIIHKGTEAPYSGKFESFNEKGTYTCKRCGAHLYRSDDKFDANCGWPSFDNEIPGAIKRIPDADGIRTEIECASCGAHLGHVFKGEHFTARNTRHCVNSISLDFIPKTQAVKEIQKPKTDTAIFAGGCFWGVEYYMHKSPGVLSVKSGYTGGHKDNPTYKEVCAGTTGHIEAVEIIFDPAKTTYETLARLFFEIHDPTQLNHQGPDYGEQYQSAVFYRDEEQKLIAEKLITLLKNKGINIVTKLRKATIFWVAEDYHQEYYEHKGSTPYCHGYVKRF
jgi:peptide methionine sulfoxide reductase msrA/msrB